MRGMHKQLRIEFIVQVLIYIVGIFILMNILLPIINPVSIATDANVGQTTFYEKILDSSIPSIKVTQESEDDENRKGTFSIIFKYLTNIDISNPKSYIASQIPMLHFIDMTSIASNESGPYIEVIPKDNETLPDNITENSTIPNNQEPTQTPTQIPDSTNQNITNKIDPTKPVVLIYHTHNRENYNPLDVKDQDYSYDFNIGVCKVGEELKRELESKYGITVVHDTTVHDVPTRDGGYTRSRKTVESYLKKYKTLKLIIDLHRDGSETNIRNISTAKINNIYYSRVMFVIGSGNKKVASSVATANKLSSKFNELYPGFSRGLYYSSKYSVYNQDLSPNIALIEIGSNGNSLDESIRSSKLVARVISEVLKK
jgi:stage II sporulation protein P